MLIKSMGSGLPLPCLISIILDLSSFNSIFQQRWTFYVGLSHFRIFAYLMLLQICSGKSFLIFFELPCSNL